MYVLACTSLRLGMRSLTPHTSLHQLRSVALAVFSQKEHKPAVSVLTYYSSSIIYYLSALCVHYVHAGTCCFITQRVIAACLAHACSIKCVHTNSTFYFTNDDITYATLRMTTSSHDVAAIDSGGLKTHSLSLTFYISK